MELLVIAKLDPKAYLKYAVRQEQEQGAQCGATQGIVWDSMCCPAFLADALKQVTSLWNGDSLLTHMIGAWLTKQINVTQCTVVCGK